MNWPDVAAGAIGMLATVATVALGIRLRGKAPPSGAGLRGVGRPRPIGHDGAVAAKDPRVEPR